jgi:glucan phosphorylase
MKAALNGTPHLAIEISGQDAADARACYGRLEEEIVPSFYHRDRADVPTAWIGRMRETMRKGIPRFTVRRAVKGAAERLEPEGTRAL